MSIDVLIGGACAYTDLADLGSAMDTAPPEITPSGIVVVSTIASLGGVVSAATAYWGC